MAHRKFSESHKNFREITGPMKLTKRAFGHSKNLKAGFYNNFQDSPPV
ncbi:hypothetical protein LEP1GSC036_1114 [Leptospira weilii str. 2006001853]|uniref:Uncharacterized protein n=4 Tax=Leptospira weilii TaxID=28184 RepID=A0A828YYL7_9LEPT|nr:hypothetical protein LEP1GSC036_1114 [Leptospira weilii str. 2006001853]EMM70746.1 hypothetical protein LEP1GSC038_1291 [Leptospira weilii str. 2006001855]EMN44957.1 hypothetical protein LEP1GSC086_0199 [Leptospira weilii str. LNT 1234]EMN89844.1 hypothetical protein LEP1GSC108_2719 [Leptospira weilii str. UI 13098]EMY12575.1 hypothetical protein LEP1GSC043_3241 [Leptospira weilii str. Ecochallenge]